MILICLAAQPIPSAQAKLARLTDGIYSLQSRISCKIYFEPLMHAFSFMQVLLMGFTMLTEILSAHCEFSS